MTIPFSPIKRFPLHAGDHEHRLELCFQSNKEYAIVETRPDTSAPFNNRCEFPQMKQSFWGAYPDREQAIMQFEILSAIKAEEIKYAEHLAEV